MIADPQRKNLLELVDAAVRDGARQHAACELLGITARCLQRWRQGGSDDGPRLADGRRNREQKPVNALTTEERQTVLDTVNHPDYAHLPPTQIVPLLADQGRYIGSESTLYRVLREAGQLAHRRIEREPRNVAKPRALDARAPHQIVCWDISYLPTDVRGSYFYLYLLIDLYSRCIVAWQVQDVECQHHASALMKDYALQHHITADQVTLHADNGAVMKASTLYATLKALGINTSHGRPSVSNDNPYVESVFHTLKYRPDLKLKPFQSLDAARDWVGNVVHWYNTEHRHSSIRYVTPQQRHDGEDVAILKNRHAVYQQAKAANPQRWSGNTRNWEPIEVVHLNPEKDPPKPISRANAPSTPQAGNPAT